MLYYGANINLDNIVDKLLISPFFDLFENNQMELLDNSYNKIIGELFNTEIKCETNKDNPIYWAGFQYMNIFLNTLIPLKQIFLLYPLKEAISDYNIYHEMNEIEIVKKFISQNYEKSILREIRKYKNLSVRKLSVLTSIPIETL